MQEFIPEIKDTEYNPVSLYECVGFSSREIESSPKFHNQLLLVTFEISLKNIC